MHRTVESTSRAAAVLLVESLERQGVDRFFCVPGESCLAVLDALRDKAERVSLVVYRHERDASNMADAYGKLTGRPGICFVTQGLGATNAAIGVPTAFQDSTPMVHFVGQVAREFRDREGFQEVDLVAMFRPLAKWAAQIDDARRIPEYVHRAFHTATARRPGPVVLALPEDMLSEVVAATIDLGLRAAGERVSETAEIEGALQRVLASPTGGLIEIILDIEHLSVRTILSKLRASALARRNQLA